MAAGLFLFLFPLTAQNTISRAQQQFENGNFSETRRICEQLIAADPNNTRALYYLGLVLMNGDYDKAIDYLEKAVELKPMDASYHDALAGAYGTKAQRAGFLKKFGAARSCKDHLEKAVALAPDSIGYRRDLLEYYLQAPGIAGGSADKAREQAAEIMKRDKGHGLLAAARIYGNDEQWNNEEDCYKKYIAAYPDNLTGYYNLVSFYARRKDLAGLNRSLQRGLAAAGTTEEKSQLCLNAAEGCLQMKEYSTARGMVFEMMKIDTTNMMAYYELGKLAAVSGEGLADGLLCFDKYLAAYPKKNFPSWAAAHWRKGMIYEKMKDKEKARQEYQRSLQLEPAFEQAKKSLDDL